MIWIAICSVVLVMSLLITPSLSWFVPNRTASAGDSGIDSASASEAVLSPYTLYVKSGDSYSAYTSESSDVRLNAYDPVLGPNRDTAAYLRVAVSNVPEGSSLTFTVTCADTSGTPSLSDALALRCASIPSAGLTTPEEIYTAADTYFSNHTLPALEFATCSNGVITGKRQFISLPPLSASDYQAEDGSIYVYLQLDYSYDLADACFSAFGGTNTVLQSDLSQLQLTVSAGE